VSEFFPLPTSDVPQGASSESNLGFRLVHLLNYSAVSLFGHFNELIFRRSW